MEFFVDKFEAFIGVNPFTMIFAWINLLILYLFLKKLLFVPVKKMIDSRQKEIDDMYSDAEASKAESEKMKAEYEKKLSSATEESEEILKKATRRAQLREEEILKEANLYKGVVVGDLAHDVDSFSAYFDILETMERQGLLDRNAILDAE